MIRFALWKGKVTVAALWRMDEGEKETCGCHGAAGNVHVMEVRIGALEEERQKSLEGKSLGLFVPFDQQLAPCHQQDLRNTYRIELSRTEG